MKISDVIKQISSIVDTTPMDRSSGDNTSKFTAFTGDLTPVELPEEEAEVLRKPGKMPSGNDAMPEDLYLPPLQLKSELLKKAVDVENVFSDGTPAVRYDEEYGDEGWHGDDNDHNYIGAPQTAEEVDGQPDPNETTDGSDSERERADESLNRILQLAMVKEADQHWDKDMYDTDRSSKKSIVKSRKDAVLEWDDYDEDDEVSRGDRELARMKQFVNPANFDADDSFTVSIDDEEEQLDELSKGTLGSYVKKAGRSAGNIGSKLGQQRATSDEVDRFTNRHMQDKYDTRDVLKKQLGASSRDQDDTLDKFGRRTTGIDRAVDRLTRESDGMDEAWDGRFGSEGAKAFKYNELRHELRGEEPRKKSSRPNPMYSKAGGYTSNRMRPGAVGYTFFNVPSGKEKEAERLGLQRTKSGKYALAHIYPDKERYASSIEELEQAFGPGKYWEPKRESAVNENFNDDFLKFAKDFGNKRGIDVKQSSWSDKQRETDDLMKKRADDAKNRPSNEPAPKSTTAADWYDEPEVRAGKRYMGDSVEQIAEESKELNRMKKLAGLNPVVLDELSDDTPV